MMSKIITLGFVFGNTDGCNWNDVLHTLGAHVGLLMVGNGGRLPLIVSDYILSTAASLALPTALSLGVHRPPALTHMWSCVWQVYMSGSFIVTVAGDTTVFAALNHPSIAGRTRRNKGGGNGKNCGVINVEFFAKPDDVWFGKDLYELVARVALSHSSFVERWTSQGLFTGKRPRSGAAPAPATASQVAAYIRMGNMVTNLALALMAKAIGDDIYVVTSHAIESVQCVVSVTKYAHSVVLDAQATIGQPVGEAELCDVFAHYRGPVLYFTGGHWAAYPLTASMADGGAANEGTRPRRFRASYH